MESPVVHDESLHNGVNRYLSASNDYDGVDFKSDRLYNEKAPEFWVSWIIAGVLTILATIQYVQRVQRLRHHFAKDWTGRLRLRALISAYIDHNDDPFFVITKFSAQSLWFLGGIQIHYEVAFSVMLGVFGLESSLDSFRVLLGYWEASSLAEYRPTHDSIKYRGQEMTQLSPSSVYEDLTRSLLIVFMVFFTQAVLIAFVVADIFENPTHTCLDGTPGCPVAGTLGSWSLYILGAFMALVFLLGPKTAYGQSEQNPAYWMKLMILAKKTGAQVSWHDPVKDVTCQYSLTDGDYRIWIRFVMNFLISKYRYYPILAHIRLVIVKIRLSSSSLFFVRIVSSSFRWRGFPLVGTRVTHAGGGPIFFDGRCDPCRRYDVPCGPR
jgi:hypothetical protein